MTDSPEPAMTDRHEKLLHLADKLHEYAEYHPDQASHVEPILDHIGMELKEHSPLSPKCTAILAEPVRCDDFRKTLSYSMCLAWKKLESGETKRMSEAMKAARTETFTQCRREGVPP